MSPANVLPPTPEQSRRADPMTVTDTTVTLDIHPSSVPAADLPLVLVHDVARTLRAHGLDPDLLALSSALYGVVEATSVENGGQAVPAPVAGQR
jgi:hypothetical protein